MKSITKKSARLVGSAGSLSDIVNLIQSRWYWTIRDTRPSEQFSLRWGDAFDIETPKSGWKDDAFIACSGGRWGFYLV